MTAEHVQDLSASRLRDLRTSTLDRAYVSLGSRRTASVHEFYRYPARFPPAMARAAIDAFTRPGDLVVDPFCGGGTTAVEAQLSGRAAYVADLNSLATFVTRAKTTVYSDEILDAVSAFADEVADLRVVATDQLPALRGWDEAGYLRNIGSRDTWRLRNLLGAAVEDVDAIDNDQARMLVRCALLRTGQWALDMRREVPDVAFFRSQLEADLRSMVETARLHRAQVLAIWERTTEPLVLTKALPDSAADMVRAGTTRPRLILTSPPYPRVYVNYHRWKVRGRKESPAPYWLADSMDGQGISYYTMSARTGDGSLARYFEKLRLAYQGIVSLMDQETWLVHVVGFNDPPSQFNQYLEVMASLGLEEVKFDELATEDDGRLWRSVPSRRWWVTAVENAQTAPTNGRETVLIHRLRSVTQR